MTIGRYELCTYVLPLMNSNMFMMISDDSSLIIDPIVDDEAFKMLEKSGIGIITVILTHEHFDHISGVNRLRKFAKDKGGKCTVYANDNCSQAIRNADTNLARFFEALFITRSDEERRLAEKIFDSDYCCDADIIFSGDFSFEWEDISVKMRSTPGHSPGSICVELYNGSGEILALATGDSLVEGNSVITRLPKGSKSDYKSITRPYLESFDPGILVLPGHGEISYMRDLELG